MKNVAETNNKYFASIVDIFTNIRNVKIFSNSNLEVHNNKRAAFNILKSQKSAVNVQIKLQAIRFVITFFLLFSVICTSAVLLSKKQIQFGDFTYIIIILSISRFFLDNFIRNFNNFFDTKAKIENSLLKLYQPIEIEDRTKDKLKVPKGKIVFKHVVFSYNKEY